MPNLCSYEMKIVGKENNIKKLHEIMNRNYNGNSTDKIHLWRVFDADYATEPEKRPDGKYEAIIFGDCAWSVSSCMFDSKWSYQSTCNNTGKGRTIYWLSKLLNLDIEIWSEEYGMCFQEHYLIRKGEVVIDDCVDAEEEYNEETDEYNVIGGFDNYCTYTI